MTGTVKEWCQLIEVHITKNSLTVKGHAGYAERGKDIVCAAVSALVQGLMHSLNALTYDACEGYAKLEYDNLSEQGKLLIDSFFIAVTDIQEAYGSQYVTVL